MDKKITFGFNKISKKPNTIFNNSVQKKQCNVELIKCIEKQTIQLVEEKCQENPLVIPLKDDQKTAASLKSLIIGQAGLPGLEILNKRCETQISNKLGEQTENLNEDIECRATRELLAELRNNVETDNTSNLVLQNTTDATVKQSTIDDYDSIPVSGFGYAILRGMGWRDEYKKKTIDYSPAVRPKGMGLGADKAMKAKPLLVPPDANEVLEIRKGIFVRILGGKYKNAYGVVEGLDEHAGRVIVKLALGGGRESFNEFILQGVSRKEYVKFSKHIQKDMNGSNERRAK